MKDYIVMVQDLLTGRNEMFDAADKTNELKKLLMRKSTKTLCTTYI